MGLFGETMKLVHNVRNLPGTPAAQEEIFNELLEKVRAGEIVYITALAITKSGDYVRCDSGVASVLERIGLLEYSKDAILDQRR